MIFIFALIIEKQIFYFPICHFEITVILNKYILLKYFYYFSGEEKKDAPVVIPMLGSKTWHDRIINKIDADIFEPKTNCKINNETQNIKIKEEKIDNVPNGNISNEIIQPMEVSEIKKEPDTVPLTLDQQAAHEIISDLKSDAGKVKEQNVFALPIVNNDDLKGKEEVSLTYYTKYIILTYV
jgi:hypothetical protein